MKPLTLKLIPSQVPLTKVFNFSNNYVLVHITFCWKSSTRIDREKFQKMFSNQQNKEFLCSFLLKNGITHKKVCLWWRVVESCISHASGKVLPGLVKFSREIFYKSRFFKHIETAPSEITRNNQSFLIRLQVAEHHCISYRIFSNFSCVLLLSSVLTFSVLFSPTFCRDEVKMLFDIH